ncbi:DUF5677 domain-containing protein [Nocardioides sp.]|uniref:DUF5677 domain-containing protein n=1 Tax=Nocardioides sp. TaxID=35761 RepID=UPI00261C673A|nr:DUF5677 domain-containing protein [Nocardioides sp.]
MPTDDECRAVFEEMLARFRDLPAPETGPVDLTSFSDVAGVEALLVAYGWTARVVRTAHAAIRLDSDGFATEASPMVRSMAEHLIALHWVTEQRGDAFQALLRAWQHELSRFKEAESAGWKLDPDIIKAVDELRSLETDKASLPADALARTRHAAERYGLGVVYRAWLVESWTSHASYMSAKTYYDYDPTAALEFTLRGDDPSRPSDVTSICTAMTHAALGVYSRMLPGGILTDDLSRWSAVLGPGNVAALMPEPPSGAADPACSGGDD